MGYFATLAAGGRPSGNGILTFLEGLAAEIEGIDELSLARDPTRWANALPRAAGLVGSRSLAVGGGLLQRGLHAALVQGSAALVDALVDTISRLAETERGKRDLAVLLPGPGRLIASGSEANDVKAKLVGLVERVCTSRPAMVLLDEREDAVLDGAACRRLTATLRNVADHYGVALGIRLADVADPLAAIGSRRNLRLDHLLLADPTPGGAGYRAAATAAGWRSLGLGGSPIEPAAAGAGGTEIWFALTGTRADIETLKRALAGA